MKQSFWALALIVALATGCGTTAANTIEVQSNGKTMTDSPNGDLADDISLSARSAFVDQYMEVAVNVLSAADEEIRLEWQVKWFSSDGFELSETTRLWEPFRLAAREDKQLKAVAPEPGAARCRVLVRYQDEN